MMTSLFYHDDIKMRLKLYLKVLFLYFALVISLSSELASRLKLFSSSAEHAISFAHKC